MQALIQRIFKSYKFLFLVGGAGAALHFGTAALRLNTFFPVPRLLDFSGFYTAAWALRLGLSPYAPTPEFIQPLQQAQQIPVYPPPIYNPPFWPTLLLPFTLLNFPGAAYVWLLLNLLLLVGSAVLLARMAGYQKRGLYALTFLLVVTFGPVFLDLTLGQTSVVLLACALGMGLALQPGRRSGPAIWAVALATGAKLFPLIWTGALFLLRRWKLFLLSVLACLIALGGTFLITPQGSRDFWFRDLPQRLGSATGDPSMDDQSLFAWVDRLGRPQTFGVPGLSATEQEIITWTPPWSIPARALQGIALVLALALGLLVMRVLLPLAPAHAEGGFYLWVLYGLAVFPHIERYNHTLLLPAMAWLWGRDGIYRKIAVAAYLLAGLSRLNHLWIKVLPAPWGPLAAGFGLYAVLAVGTGMALALWPGQLRRHSHMEGN